MFHFRNVKIVATIGPASDSPNIIESLILSGVNAFRINMSHGDKETHLRNYKNIRAAEEKLNRPVGVLADLQGPKLRIGCFKDAKITLKNGDIFTFDQVPDRLGDKSRVYLPHPEIFKILQPGNIVLLDDGRIRLKVTSCSVEGGISNIVTEVIVGGELSNNKGVNIPDVALPVSALSDKDIDDLVWACNMEFDWVALSFVQRPEDIIHARHISEKKVALIAKIEKPQAISCIDEILRLSDGIMVARGDLGVEFPMEEVPIIQKKLIRKARSKGKPIIVATQMMESMVSSSIPTRAETSDVANAIYDGADAIMLSAESAVGSYPVETVKFMDKIARAIEQDPFYRQTIDSNRTKADSTTSDSITAAAREVAETSNIRVICNFTFSGTTAIRCARERPRVPILSLTPLRRTARKLTLVWGLFCVVTNEVKFFKEALQEASNFSRSLGFAANGDAILVTAGIPFNTPGTTNVLRIITVSDRIDNDDF